MVYNKINRSSTILALSRPRPSLPTIGLFILLYIDYITGSVVKIRLDIIVFSSHPLPTPQQSECLHEQR